MGLGLRIKMELGMEIHSLQEIHYKIQVMKNPDLLFNKCFEFQRLFCILSLMLNKRELKWEIKRDICTKGTLLSEHPLMVKSCGVVVVVGGPRWTATIIT